MAAMLHLGHRLLSPQSCAGLRTAKLHSENHRMRWRRALILAAVAAAPASAGFAQANNPTANSTRPENPLLKALEACRKIPDAAQRVACYDAASAALVNATTS